MALRAPHLARAAGCTADQERQLRQRNVEGIISEDLIDELTLSGTVGDCVRKLESIAALDIEHVTLYPRGPNITKLVETVGREGASRLPMSGPPVKL